MSEVFTPEEIKDSNHRVAIIGRDLETHLRVDIEYDDKAHVWVATSEDVPGLVLQSESYDILIERVRSAIPKLLELN